MGASKITLNSSFALSVSAKYFAKCSAKSFAKTFDNCFKKFRFSIHFLPVFQSILKIQATHVHQLEAHSYPHSGFALKKQSFLFFTIFHERNLAKLRFLAEILRSFAHEK